jgi:hypothetical protein
MGRQTHRPVLDQAEIRETDMRLKSAFAWLGLAFKHDASFVGLFRPVRASAGAALSSQNPSFLPTRIREDPERKARKGEACGNCRYSEFLIIPSKVSNRFSKQRL